MSEEINTGPAKHCNNYGIFLNRLPSTLSQNFQRNTANDSLYEETHAQNYEEVTLLFHNQLAWAMLPLPTQPASCEWARTL